MIARQHGGRTVSANLALACIQCNLYKGPNVAGIDPATGEIVRLFHPRQDKWTLHFAWSGARLIGITPVRRTTIQTLKLNRSDVVELRESQRLE